ncbi:MAG: hypothetical protein KTV16_16405, partial [Acidimicrobiia bacterium]|nr:hypothetical protein [Acidimicrobiia bacterium]
RSRLKGDPNPGISGPLARCPLRVETERRDAQFREGVVAGTGDRRDRIRRGERTRIFAMTHNDALNKKL